VWALAGASDAADGKAPTAKLTQGAAVAQAGKPTQTEPRKTRPLYKPPARGTPAKKVGGGARGAGDCAKPLTLAPEHVAQTVSASPALFWYIESVPPSTCELVLVVQDEDSVEPLAEIVLPTPKAAGIQRIDLGRLGIVLQPEVEYEWLVSVVPDASSHSTDLISNAYILRVAPPPDLPDRSAWSYAERGIWYDALAAISNDVDAHPDDQKLREARNALLSQVGLGDAVEP
jgi:hypothetical protein